MRISAYLLFITLLIIGCRPIENVEDTIRLQGSEAPTTVTLVNKNEHHEDIVWIVDGKKHTGDSINVAITKSGEIDIKKIYSVASKLDTIMSSVTITGPEKCLVEINTRLGKMVVELYEETPEHKRNFLKLVEDGFYNDLLFHRVINGFMVQGGDPTSKDAPAGKQLGIGGPGYTIPAEFNSNFLHTKGALSAARQGDQVNPKRRSSGSQFYIVQGRVVPEKTLKYMEQRLGIEYTPEQIEAYTTVGGTPNLDMQYTVFGRVVEGLDVIDKIAAVKTARGDRPVEDVKMEIVVVE